MNSQSAAKHSPFPQKALIVGPYPPVVGGTAAMLNRLVPALENAGVTCRVLNTKVGDRQGGKLERTGRLLFFMWIALRASAARERIIHCHAVNFANLLGHGLVIAACRLAGKHVVLTLHAGDLIEKISRERSRRLGGCILRMAHVVTTVTPELQAAVQKLGVPRCIFIANDLSYIPGNADDHELPREVETFIDGHNPVAVLVGGMNPPYGIDVFLRAAMELKSSHPKFGALVIAFKSNDNRYQIAIASLVTELKLQDSVLFPQPFPNVPEAVRRSHVFVRPTLRDGDSIAVREAMALGLPVVASNVGFRPQGVLLFPAGDHVQLAARIVEAFSGPRPHFSSSADAEKRTVAAFVDTYRLAWHERGVDEPGA